MKMVSCLCLLKPRIAAVLKQACVAAQMTYEAYGAGGTGFVIECLTDNVNRSATEVRCLI